MPSDQVETVDVPLTGGLNLDDPKSIGPGEFSVLDNADFDPVRKRHGHVRLPVWIAGNTNYLGVIGATNDWAYGFGLWKADAPSGGIGVPVAEVGKIRGVAALSDDLLAWDGFRLLSYDATPAAGWNRVADTSQGSPAGVAVIAHATESAPMSNYAAINLDVAVGRNRTLYTWSEGSPAVPYYAVFNNVTGGIVTPRTALGTGGTDAAAVKPVYLTNPDQTGGVFFVYVSDAASLSGYYARISELDGTVALGTLVTDKAANDSAADVCAYGDTAYVVYTATGPVLKLVTISQANTTSSTTLNTNTRTPSASRPVAMSIHPNGTVMVAWHSTATIYAAFYSPTVFGRIYTEATVSAQNPQRLTCSIQLIPQLGTYDGFVGFWLSATNQTWVTYVTGASTGGTSKLGDSKLTHQMIRVGNSVFVTVGYSRTNTLQYQLVTLHCEVYVNSFTLIPVASSFRETYYPSTNAGFFVLQASRTDFSDDDNCTRWALATETGKLLPTATAVQQIKVGTARVDFEFLPPLRTTHAGDSLWFAGGVVKEYDGASFHEVGFLTYPQLTSALAAGGTLPTTGTPQYRAYLILTNARGEQHRSAAISHTPTSPPSGGNLSYTLTLPMVPYMTHQTAQWEIYRLDYLASTFKRLVTVDVTASTVRFTDATYVDTGTAVTSNAVDPAPSYAPNGLGVLDKIAPPSCTLIAAGKERVWFAGGGVPDGQIAYTRLYDPGETAMWNEGLVMNIPGEGSITGLGFLGDGVVAFRQNQIYIASGPGEDNLGSGYFDTPRVVNADTGCISADSIVNLSAGLAFQSSGGLVVLPYSLGIDRVGEPIRFATDERNKVTCAAVSPAWRQARFVMEDGAVYVLDYSAQPRWTRWTTKSNGIVEYMGKIAVASDDSSVLIEDSVGEETGSDGNRGYDFHMVTGWLKPGASGGLASLDWWYLLADWQGPSDVLARVDFDYKLIGPTVDERIWKPTTIYSGHVDYGPADLSGYTFGVGANEAAVPFYYTFGNLDIRRRFRRRRASAVRFGIRSVGSGKGFAVNALSIEYRSHRGIAGRSGRNLS